MERNGHAVEVGMQFAVVEVTHGVESGTCVKLYKTSFGGPFWAPLTDVLVVAGDGVNDADVSQRANMLTTLRQMQLAKTHCTMPRPHGTDSTRLYKCGGCSTRGPIPLENGICKQCHTALSVTFNDVTIRHLFDENLPGMVELTYRVLENWKERCPIDKIEEQVEFRKGTRKYKQKHRKVRAAEWYEQQKGTSSRRCGAPAEFTICMVPSYLFTSFTFAQSSHEQEERVQRESDVHYAESSYERVERDVDRPAVESNRAVAEASAESEKQECVACTERPPNQVMLPCAHLCLCKECVETATANGRCPMCNTEFTQVLQVFLP